MSTDIAKLEQLFRELNVPFTVEAAYNENGSYNECSFCSGRRGAGKTTVKIESSYGGNDTVVGGYMGFHVDFDFDDVGSLVSVGIWE